MREKIIELVVDHSGTAHFIYSDDFDLAGLGEIHVARASHVEPDGQGHWWADLAPVNGPKLGPFQRRSQGLEAEVTWLRRHWLLGTSTAI